jgi:hypothetical protein
MEPMYIGGLLMVEMGRTCSNHEQTPSWTGGISVVIVPIPFLYWLPDVLILTRVCVIVYSQ